MAKSLDMTTGKPSKLLLQFAIPLIIGNLFQQAYTLADRVIVGQFVGADAYSAVGATTALTNLFMSVCMGMSIGAGVVVAQYFGAKDEKNTASAIINSAYISLILAVILLAVFWIGGDLIMTIFVPNQEIISISAKGIRITSLFFMALGTVQITRYLLNGAGDSVYSMMNGAIEIVARIAFVFILTAIPFIGMWGIFITTGLTWLVTALFALWRYKKGAWMNKSLV